HVPHHGPAGRGWRGRRGGRRWDRVRRDAERRSRARAAEPAGSRGGDGWGALDHEPIRRGHDDPALRPAIRGYLAVRTEGPGTNGALVPPSTARTRRHWCAMFIRYFVEIARPKAEVEAELLRAPGRWWFGPARDAEARGEGLLADVGFGPPGARIG